MESVLELRSTPVAGEYDLIVAGGGVAGVAAAVQAKRAGSTFPETEPKRGGRAPRCGPDTNGAGTFLRTGPVFSVFARRHAEDLFKALHEVAL